MNGVHVPRTLYGFSRSVAAARQNWNISVTRNVCGGYNEHIPFPDDNVPNRVGPMNNSNMKKQRDEYPEFGVDDGQGQMLLHSHGAGRGRLPLEPNLETNFAFQIPEINRSSFVRTYRDETGTERQKWDVGEENKERLYRQNTGRGVEERRQHEISTTGFPESFNPGPRPHSDGAADRSPHPVPRLEEEMHLPNVNPAFRDTRW